MVLSRSLVAEALGTAFLLAAIVGSGIMAERLAGGNVAIALLCNSVATGAMLVVLITIFRPCVWRATPKSRCNPRLPPPTFHLDRSRGSLCLMSDCWRSFRNMGRARHVWRSDLSSFDQSTRGTKPVVRRGCGDLRAHSGNPWYTSVETG